jgi:hypothetical protein
MVYSTYLGSLLVTPSGHVFVGAFGKPPFGGSAGEVAQGSRSDVLEYPAKTGEGFPDVPFVMPGGAMLAFVIRKV